MPKAREDEKRYMRLLRPALHARIVSSSLAFIGMATAVFYFHVFSLASFIIVTAGLVIVNVLSFYFIRKDYPLKIFVAMNGFIFNLILAVAVYYTGSEQSPLMLTYLMLIMISAIVSNSKLITIGLSVLACLSLDALIYLQYSGIIESRDFFMQLHFSVFDDTGLKYAVILWNLFLLGNGIFFGYMGGLLGRIRYELQTANDENIRLQGIVRKLVSRDTWDEASNAAKRNLDVLEEHTAEKTIMFTDIAGFSSISERISPIEVIAMLNRHFDTLSEIIYGHNGDIDKFIGDSVMAVFNDASDAVEAALDIQKQIAAESKKAGFDDPAGRLKVRIGINTGEVVIGNMGGTRRLDRSLIGDAVNVAQRLESMAKTGGILVSAATYKAIGRGRFKFRRVGPVRIKGKKKRIAAYSLNPPEN